MIWMRTVKCVVHNMRTTYHLQYIVDNYQYFTREVLMSAKRELDKRLRVRAINSQKKKNN